MREKKLEILNGKDFRSVAFVLLTNGYTVRAEIKRTAPHKTSDAPKARASLFFSDPKEEKEEKDKADRILEKDEVDRILEKISDEPIRRVPRSIWKDVASLRTAHFRRYPLGLGNTKIPAASTRTIKLEPKLPVKIISLSLPGNKMEGLVIEDIKVDRLSQFQTPGEIPAECFDPSAVQLRLCGDTAIPGKTIYVTVSNRTRKPIMFTGFLLGELVI